MQHISLEILGSSAIYSIRLLSKGVQVDDRDSGIGRRETERQPKLYSCSYYSILEIPDPSFLNEV